MTFGETAPGNSAIGSGKDWGYTKFYNPDGTVDEAKVASLMEKLGVKPEL